MGVDVDDDDVEDVDGAHIHTNRFFVSCVMRIYVLLCIAFFLEHVDTYKEHTEPAKLSHGRMEIKRDAD